MTATSTPNSLGSHYRWGWYEVRELVQPSRHDAKGGLVSPAVFGDKVAHGKVHSYSLALRLAKEASADGTRYGVNIIDGFSQDGYPI